MTLDEIYRDIINICKKILFYKSMVDRKVNVDDISFVIKFQDIISK